MTFEILVSGEPPAAYTARKHWRNSALQLQVLPEIVPALRAPVETAASIRAYHWVRLGILQEHRHGPIVCKGTTSKTDINDTTVYVILTPLLSTDR